MSDHCLVSFWRQEKIKSRRLERLIVTLLSKFSMVIFCAKFIVTLLILIALQEYGTLFYECSALNGNMVQEALAAMAW